jgi:hypothetical protein
MGQFVDRARDHEYVAGVFGGAPLAQRNTRWHRHVVKRKVRYEACRKLVVTDLGGRAVAFQEYFSRVADNLLLPVADPAIICGGANTLHAARPEVVMPHVVVARPDDFYGALEDFR